MPTATLSSTGQGAATAPGATQVVRVHDLAIHVHRTGQGPDVLLLAGLGDPIEAWQAQMDGLSGDYRLTAFDNRGVGRTPMPPGPVTVEAMADDAAGVLRGLGIAAAHVAGFSGGSIIAQELALRHPTVVRSLVLQSTWARLDQHLDRWARHIRWLIDVAPSDRDFLEAFYLWIYTPHAHASGLVDTLIDEALAFPHPQDPRDLQATLDAYLRHQVGDRLRQIQTPTLVLAGENDPTTRPDLGRAVADLIPGARFQVVRGASHQPFQEDPDAWNAQVSGFWREVSGG